MLKKLSLQLAFLGLAAFTAQAQTTPGAQAFGKIDKADLDMKACDFEKDANAMVYYQTRTCSD